MDASAKPSKTPSLELRKRYGRWLHFIYFRAAGLQHFFSRRIRPAGIAVAIVFVITTFLCAGERRNSTYQLFALSLAMLLIGLIIAMFRRVKMSAIRELPRQATAGQMFSYTVQISSHDKRRLQRAWLSESAPDPRPSLTDFLNLAEPGEEERNRFDRTLLYFRWQWLLLKNRLFVSTVSSQVIDLKAGASSNIRLEITPLRRGIFHFDDLRILLPDPFGLFQKCRKIDCPAATLIVLPRRYSLPALELPGQRAFKTTGEASSNRLRGDGEFASLRDYRPGDPMRQIHWKSWARTGRPVIKEYEDTCQPRHGLIIDTFHHSNCDDPFEALVSVAASFISASGGHGSLVDFIFLQSDAHRLNPSHGLNHTKSLLELLATIAPARQNPYQSLTKTVLRHSAELSSCIVLFCGWDAQRADFLNRLIRQQIVCVPLIIGTGPAPPEVPGHWLDTAEIARSLRCLPLRLSIATRPQF
jgi:uncharacterized protein (DUF58 family)